MGNFNLVTYPSENSGYNTNNSGYIWFYDGIITYYIKYIYIYMFISGWWLSPTPLKNMTVSWGYDIPKIWKVITAMFQTTNQYERLVDSPLVGGFVFHN